MACAPKNLTEDQVTAMALQQRFFGHINENSTPLDKIKALIELRNNFTSVEVEASRLNKKVNKMLMLEKNEIVKTYQAKEAVGNILPTLSRTITMSNQEAFLKSKQWKRELADEIRNNPDSVLASMTGTNLHTVLDSIMYDIKNHIKAGNNIYTSEEIGDIKTTLSLQEIKQLLGIETHATADKIINNLIAGVMEIYQEISKTQAQIDPSGKAAILTEQFIADFSRDIGGTMDMFVMYSDGSVALFDYKSKLFDSFNAEKVGDNWKITNEMWVPEYLRENLGRQLGSTKDILKKVLKVNTFRQTRGVPIFIRYQMKSQVQREKGSQFTDNLIAIQMGAAQDPLLSQLPIHETVSNKALDRAIGKLEKDIHNKRVSLGQKGTKAEKDLIRLDIERKQKALDKLIIKQDLKGLYDDFKTLLDRYNNEAGELVDIDNEFIGNKRNLKYLNSRKLDALIEDLSAYRSLLASSEMWLADLNMEGVPLGEYMNEIAELSSKISSMLNSLNRKRFERTIDGKDMGAIENMQKISFIDEYFLGSKEFNQIVIKRLHEKISEANAERILKTQELEKEIKDDVLKVQEWARSNGMSLNKVWALLIKGERLISKYNKKLREDINAMRAKGDLKGLKKIYKLKDNAQEIFNQREEDFLETNPTEYSKKVWYKYNSIESAVLYPFNAYIYYDYTDHVETSSEYISEEYAEIAKPQNKALLDFYNMWTDKMKTFRKLLEITEYETLPNNFLPNIRASVQDLIATGNFTPKQARELAESWMHVKVDNTEFGNDPTSELTKRVNLETGFEKPEVAKFYLNPLKDNKGRLIANAQLRDLPSSLLQFGNMAYNYHYLTTKVEPHIEAYRDVIAMYGEMYTTESGVQKVDAAGRPLSVQDKLTSISKMFEEQVRYHVYGHKILDENKKIANTLLNLKQFHSNYTLAGAWLTWMGNAIQIFTNTFFESGTAYHFNLKQLRNSMATAMGAMSNPKSEKSQLYTQLIRFFEANSDLIRLKAKNLKSSAFQKIADSDTNYIGFRIAEHGVENIVMYSMLQSHGLLDGKIVRLESKSTPKGTKSLLELARLDSNGELIIEGLKDSADNSKVNLAAYTDIRGRARGVAKDIKGGMDSENQMGVQMWLAGKMFMQYKGWLPGMLTQRFGGLMYNHGTKSMRQGWYRTFYDQALRPEEGGFVNYLATQLLPTTGKLLAALATRPLAVFGKNLPYRFKASETRARRSFEAYKAKNFNDVDVQNMSFEEFVEYQEGRIRSMITEILVALTFVTAVMMGRRDWDEDGVPDWRASWYSRTLFRITNRARRELNFVWSIGDWRYTLTRSPVPAIGVIEDFHKILQNTLRETGDFVWSREESEKKGKGIMKYTPRVFPWYKFYRSIDMLDKEFEKLEV
jgi:hypothetical protein